MAAIAGLTPLGAQDQDEDAPKSDPPNATAPAKPAEKPAETPPAPTEKPPAAAPNGDLPWKKPAPPPEIKKVRTAKELLALRGIHESEWDRTPDGQVWGVDDDELLLKVLYHLPRFEKADVAQWQQPVADWEAYLQESDKHRGEFVALRGVVEKVEKVALIPELVDRFEYEHYYRIQWRVGDAGPRLTVYAAAVPSAWKLDAEVQYPASVAAFFLKKSAPDATPVAYLAGARIAWHPTAADVDQGVHADHVALASHGFDAGLLADLREADGRTFEGADREPFYQTLHALDALAAADPPPAAAPALDLAALLTAPADHRLQRMRVAGNVRRVVKVLVDAPDLQARFGMDHYYELDFFLPLGEQGIKLGQDTAKSKAPVYRNEFPATLCVRTLPPNIKEGDNLRLSIVADATFYRIWAYRSEYVKQFKRQHQSAPIFLAANVTLVPDPPAPAFTRTDWLVMGALLGTLIAFGLLFYFLGKRLKPAHRPSESLPEKIAINE